MATAKAQPEDIRLLCLDVDGVLTDGSINLNQRGEEIKRFFAHDGVAIKAWLGCGRHLGVITARESGATATRLRELGVKHLFQGVQEKGSVFEDLLKLVNVDAAEAAMVLWHVQKLLEASKLPLNTTAHDGAVAMHVIEGDVPPCPQHQSGEC